MDGNAALKSWVYREWKSGRGGNGEVSGADEGGAGRGTWRVIHRG